MECQKLLNDSNDIKLTLGKSRLNIKYERDGDRVVIFKNRHTNDGSYLSRECNGIILQNETWDVIAYPPPPLLLLKVPNDVYSNCTIYDANDGTTVMLYYYNNKWRLSTNRAYEVNNLKPYGTSLTFMEAFLESVNQYNLSLDDLDTELSYTIGFHNNIFHPFGGENKAWLISIFAKDGTEKNIDIGLPKQREVDISVDLINFNVACAMDNYLDNGTVCLGYIIQDNSTKVRYLIESKLLKVIRNMYYNNHINKTLAMNPSYTKENYVCLDSVLRKSNIFTKIFPQFTEKCVFLTNYIDKLVKSIIDIVNNNTQKPDPIGKSILDNMLKIISMDNIKSHQDIIYDFITSKDRRSELYNIIFK
jgi:hypothetical protein